MRAVSGVLEDGRFTPLGIIDLPKRVQAVLVYNDADLSNTLEARISWLNKFHALLKDAANEEMPDFPKMRFMREPINLSDEG